WYATEKIDGSSGTILRDPDTEELRVCGRNWEYTESEGHTLWQIAREHFEWLEPQEYVQGELFGVGVQGNPLKLKLATFAVFTHGWVYGPSVEPRAWWPKESDDHMVPMLDLAFPASVEEAVEQVDG